jgi:hypothetical protein
MSQGRPFEWVGLVLVMAILFFIPSKVDRELKSSFALNTAPLWSWGRKCRHYFASRPLMSTSISFEEQKLSLENKALREQLERVRPRYFGKASIIQRSLDLWGVSCWIDQGVVDRVSIGTPVLSEGSLVGVVDEVYERTSKVALITNPLFVVAVRACRGERRDQDILFLAETLVAYLRQDPAYSQTEQSLDSLVAWLKQKTNPTLYLAKGELKGVQAPKPRTIAFCLQGEGFQFERFDTPEALLKGELVEPIIQEGDLLVTSGLDGVFPPGLSVAIVTSLQRRGRTYNLEARPTASHLLDIEEVDLLLAQH